ncbi:MAG: hypothetical protein QXY61_02830 [Candidatus Anstonellales archaeon]
MQQGTPEYQDLQAKIDKAKPYEDAQNTLQIIASLSIAWKGNIRIGDDIISLGMNEKELKEAREKIISLYGKDWSELMPATEIERSLYAAYLTKWEGKLPNEKQFEEWKREQISLYERAADKAKEIADLLEKGASQEEIEKALIGLDYASISLLAQEFNILMPTLSTFISTNARIFLAQEIAGVEVGKKSDNLTKDEVAAIQNAMPKALDIFNKAGTGNKEASDRVAPYYAMSIANFMIDGIRLPSVEIRPSSEHLANIITDLDKKQNKVEEMGSVYFKQNLLIGYYFAVSTAIGLKSIIGLHME